RPRDPRTATVVVIVATLVGSSCKSRSQDATGAAPSSSIAVPVGSTTQPVMVARGPDGSTLMSYPTVRVDEDAGPLAPGLPVPVAKVEAAVNAGHLAPYAGPTGVIEGTVTVS